MAFASKVTIEIGGNKVPEFLYISINQNFNQIHSFQLVCRQDTIEDPGNSPLSSCINKIGSVITFHFEIQSTDDNTKKFFFKGIITEISASESLSDQEITFSGYSPDILLHGYPTCRSFDNMELNSIAHDVVRNYPSDQISLEAHPVNIHTYPFIVQYKETDYEFLHRLAARFGEWFFYNGRELVFGSFQKKTAKGVLGINVLNFSVGASLVPMNFIFKSHLYGKNPTSKVESSNCQVTHSLNKIGKVAHDQSLRSYGGKATFYYPGIYIGTDGDFLHSTNRLDEVEKEKEKLASGIVVLTGSSDEPLQLGNIFEINSRGIDDGHEIYVGDYLITGVSHSLDSSMIYQNSFTAIPSESKISPDSNVNVKTLCESQSAVVKDRDDPQKLGRVRVKFLWQDDNQMSPWLRIVTPNAGKGRGFFSVPELEEEVLVDFEGGDAEHPYVIGSLFNGEAIPSKDNKDLKDMKYIISKKGSVIFLDDTENHERILICNGSDDKGHSIELDLQKKKITIASSDDIVLAGKNIHINAKDNLFISAEKKITIGADSDAVTIKSGKKVEITGSGGVNINGDTTIHGPNVSLKGDATVKAEGASVSVKGNAMVEIQAALVKIN
ncbi:MAG: phage baseplate assembly protein V [Bacteroidetes bacterium]|nr:phage baseplate assembly protein V [Bacteroidota bacterium]